MSTNNVGIQLADIVASTLRVAVHERTFNVGTRTQDYLAELQSLIAARDRMGDFPFVIGPERWQYDMMELLGMMDLLRQGLIEQAMPF